MCECVSLQFSCDIVRECVCVLMLYLFFSFNLGTKVETSNHGYAIIAHSCCHGTNENEAIAECREG